MLEFLEFFKYAIFGMIIFLGVTAYSKFQKRKKGNDV